MTMSDTCAIPLTYRGVLIHRGVGISGESYAKTWTLRLANDVWTLTDHKGDEIHSFTQKDLHRKVAFPGFARGYPDLYLVGLGPQVHCFEPEQEVLDALKHYVEQSEVANAPQLARWHRVVGVGFVGLGVLCLAGCVAVLSWALRSADVSGFLRLNVTLVLIVPGSVGGGYFMLVGVRDFLRANHFARLAAARGRLDS